MGNISSCCMPGDKPGDERSEETEPLCNPTAAVYDGGSVNGTLISPTREYGTSGGMNSSKSEASAWNRTLHKMASNVIDVSTMEVPASTIEQSDWIDRQRAYTAKINQSKVTSILKSHTKQPRPGKGTDSPADTRRPAATHVPEPISATDLALINEYSDKSLTAVKNGFVVSVNEDLVVQFNP